MIFTDEIVDLMISTIIEEEYNSNPSEQGVICYTDYRATMKRRCPGSIEYFDMFYLFGNTIQEIAKEMKLTEKNVEDRINKIRGFTLVYLVKQGSKENK